MSFVLACFAALKNDGIPCDFQQPDPSFLDGGKHAFQLLAGGFG